MKKWCRHTRIIRKWEFGEYAFTDKDGWIDWDLNIDRWKFCPICGKPRPEPRKER